MFVEIFFFVVLAFLVLWSLQKPSHFPPGTYLCRLKKTYRIAYLANQFFSAPFLTFGQKFSYTLSLENVSQVGQRKIVDLGVGHLTSILSI